MHAALRTLLFCAISTGWLWGQQNGSVPGGNNTVSGKNSSAVTTNSVLSGIVMMEDSSPLPGSVDIKMVCNGFERTVAHTMLTGDFQFQWSRASQTGSALPMGTALGVSSFMNPMTGANSDASSVVRTSIQDQPDYCDLKAWLPGYVSSQINLGNNSQYDGTNTGVLWLRPINAHQGNLVSALTLRAPRDARKFFDKGAELMHSGKFPAAESSFQKAVAVYPQYADAWLNLGRVQFKMGAYDSARTSLLRAVELDPKLPGAWQTLGYVAFNQKQWNDAAGYLCQAEQLDPLDSATPYFYGAVAYYELRKYDQAEMSIRREIDIDPQFQNRRAQFVLGLILIARHKVADGSDALRSYLAASPDPRDVASAKNVLVSLRNGSGN